MRDNDTFIEPFRSSFQTHPDPSLEGTNRILILEVARWPVAPMSFRDVLDIPPSPQSTPMGRQKQPDKWVVSATITCQIMPSMMIEPMTLEDSLSNLASKFQKMTG
jgi:hypothetical protein